MWLPCVKLLKEHRRCDYVEPNYDESAEKYFHYINNFELSSKKLGSSKEHSFIYKLEKQNFWTNESSFFGENPFPKLVSDRGSNNLDYGHVSDDYGFALLRMTMEILQVHYYDVHKKFFSFITIPFTSSQKSCFKLVNRILWIYSGWSNTDINVICIKGSTEWYHVKSTSGDRLDLFSIDSNNILITMMGYESTRLSQCKVFYLCDNNLKINGTSEIDFTDLEKPKHLENQMEDLIVVWLFRATVILTSIVDKSVFYFLAYEGLQLKSTKIINFNELYERKPVDISFDILPKLGKMLVWPIHNISQITVLDLMTIKVSQIFESPIETKQPLPENSHLRFYFKSISSGHKKEIVLVGNHGFVEPFCFKFPVFNGLSLKEQSLSIVADIFSADDIKAANIPKSLVKEILNRKL